MIKNYEYDYLNFILRGQGLHIGHTKVIETALSKAKRVILHIGSANLPRTFRNPFTSDERATMIQNVFQDDRISCVNLNDTPYNNAAWIRNVQANVESVAWNYRAGPKEKEKIGLIGHAKDHTSFYLKLFPQWGKGINVPQEVIYNATDIRKAYFTNNPIISSHVMPKAAEEFLIKFLETPHFKYIVEEWNYIKTSRAQWKDVPYPVIFQTADNIVTQSGHVLVIERKSAPGKGLYALPGGFVNAKTDMTVFDAAIRELVEETKIKIPKPVLIGSLVGKDKEDVRNTQGVRYDDINRSERGRIITNVFRYTLTDQMDLPRVRGADDAKRAFWMPFNMIKACEFFEDHAFILEKELGLTLS